MLGTVNLKAIKIPVTIGVLPEEWQKKQVLEVDISLDYDFGPAAQNDDISYAVDYAALAESLKNQCSNKSFHLLETLAEKFARHVLEQWPQVMECRLQIKKIGAVPEAAYSSVQIARNRESLKDLVE